METKLLFTSDLHGSQEFFLKALSIVKSWNVDVLLMSGDLTGKAVVPIVKFQNSYVSKFFGHEVTLEENELKEFKEKVARAGYYAYQCSGEEYRDLKATPEKVEQLFHGLMKNRLEEWINKIDEALPKNVKVILNPGNDDPLLVDELLKNSKRTLYTNERVEYIDEIHPLVTCDWVNPTPWNSPRECSEQELEKRLRKEVERVSSAEYLVCDFHAPPYDSPLDLAPKLDSTLKPKMSMLGQPVMEHVGSRAVRKVIEKYQPKLSLHGHIHESAGAFKIKRTLCVNPGSEYVEGIMHGYFLKLTDETVDYHPVTGG
jgi:Icc-related predicted phosphoesterase